MKRIFVSFFITTCFALSVLAQAKYVFFFIGDGMGPNQVLASEMYLAELGGTIGRNQLLMTTFPLLRTSRHVLCLQRYHRLRGRWHMPCHGRENQQRHDWCYT